MTKLVYGLSYTKNPHRYDLREFHDHVTRNANKLHMRQLINENDRKMTKYQG